MRYFGRWENPDGALEEYQAFLVESVKTDIVSVKAHAGITIKDAINLFLHSKELRVTAGELTSRSFEEYRMTCERVADRMGRNTQVSSLTPSDFARYREWRAENWNLVAVGNEVTRIRTMFKWLRESDYITTAVQFGPDFRKPSAKAARRHRRLSGKKLYTAEQIRLILDECGTHMRAMVLLGINCGLGNTDCADLPLVSVVEPLEVIHYPRSKTEVERTLPLWPETAEALRTSLSRRPDPLPEASGRFFVSRDRRRWDNKNQPLTKRFRRARESAGILSGGFYWLRHTFATIGGGAKDQVAVNAIMGHVDGTMASVYREEIGIDRLRAVTDHVRGWLFG